MNPRVKRVTPLKDYKLKLYFTNGEKGIFDCKPILNFGVFSELKELSYFNLVKVNNGTVVWPHEQDICPDTLYNDSEKSHG
jgi:hypothetical protein